MIAADRAAASTLQTITRELFIMAKKRAARRGGGSPPRPTRVRAAVQPAARARVGYKNNANSKFMEDQANTFRVFGDAIGNANPNKTVSLAGTSHVWTLLQPVQDIDRNTFEVQAKPHRKKKKSRSTRGTDDDLTV